MTINVTVFSQVAQEVDRLVAPDTLTEIVVTATRTLTDLAEVGLTVRPIGNAFLRRQTPRSLAEAFIGVPGVWMQKTNHGGGSPFLRGLTGNQVLLLYDGIRLNNSTYRYGPNQYFNTVDPFAVERAEVVLGGGSVLYGSDALGGTVNLLTPAITLVDKATTPTASTRGPALIRGRLLARYRTGSMEETLRGDLRHQSQNLALVGGISLRNFGNLRAGGDGGELIATGYDERAADLKVRLRTGRHSDLTAAYNGLIQTGVGRYDQVVQRGYRQYDFDPQERQLSYLRWRLQPADWAWWESLEVTGAWQSSREVRKKQREDSPILETEDDRVRTLSGSAVAGLKFLPGWSTTVGMELYHDRVYSGEINENQETGVLTERRGLYPVEATARNLAFFTHHRYRSGRWRVSAGLRYNPFRLTFDDPTFGSTDIRPDALVWEAALGYALSAGQTIQFSAFSGFRAPNINDLSSFGSFDFGVEVPSPDLLPERSLTTELAYRKQGEVLGWQVTAFRNRLTNLIERERATFLGEDQYEGQDVYTKVNRSQANIYGGELSLNYAVASHWQLLTVASYTYGEADGDPLRRIPPLNGRIEVLYRPESNWLVDAAFFWADRQDRLSGGDIRDHRIDPAGTPGWAVARLRGGYRWRSLDFQLAVENLTDTAYRMHGSGVDGAGLHLSIQLVYNPL